MGPPALPNTVASTAILRGQFAPGGKRGVSRPGMPLNCLTPADYRVVRWKNGGGWTTDIALSGDEPYRWRASRAEVETDGPFSDFSGYDRFLVLLGGNGFRLQFPDGTRIVNEPLQKIEFGGETPVVCSLMGGASTDFNWVVAREYFAGSLSILSAGESGFALIIYAVADCVIDAAGDTLEIPAGESILSDERVEFLLMAGGPVLACDAIAHEKVTE